MKSITYYLSDRDILGQGYSYFAARVKIDALLTGNFSPNRFIGLNDYINSLIGGALPKTRFTGSGIPVMERTAVVSSILSIMVA